MAYLIPRYEEKKPFLTFFFFFINRKNIVTHLNIDPLLLVSNFHLNLEMVTISTQNFVAFYFIESILRIHTIFNGQLNALFTIGKLQIKEHHA